MNLKPPQTATSLSRKAPPALLEVWGGIECTVARIGGEYRNQCEETGHSGRPDDLDAIANLGIRTLRYPVLWETIAPDSPEDSNWDWHDKQLGRLRQRGIAPITTTSLVKSKVCSRTITALTSERGLILPSLNNALDRFLRDRSTV